MTAPTSEEARRYFAGIADLDQLTAGSAMLMVKIVRLAAHGYNKKQIAGVARVTRQTVYRYLDEFRQLTPAQRRHVLDLVAVSISGSDGGQ